MPPARLPHPALPPALAHRALLLLSLAPVLACSSPRSPRPQPQGPPRLTPLAAPCSATGDSITAAWHLDPGAPNEVLRLHRSGLLEALALPSRPERIACPISPPAGERRLCLPPVATAAVFAKRDAARRAGDAGSQQLAPSDGVSPKHACVHDSLAALLAPRQRACRHPEVARALFEAVAAAREAEERAACAGARVCGLALEDVRFAHHHYPTRLRSRVELHADGRWRCEGPAPLPPLLRGRCDDDYHAASSGQLPRAQAAALLAWLLEGQPVERLGDGASPPETTGPGRDFHRLVARLPAPGERGTIYAGPRPLQQVRARWRQIAKQLDARCAVD